MKYSLTHKNIFIFFFLALSVLITSCGSSRRTVGIEAGWDLLGEKKVNFIRDKDELAVTSRNMYTALRFKVEDRDIRIDYLKIYFNNGDKLEPSINDEIKAGEASRIIDLAADGRYIDKIEFKYRTTGNMLKGRANVLVLGKRYNPYGY